MSWKSHTAIKKPMVSGAMHELVVRLKGPKLVNPYFSWLQLTGRVRGEEEATDIIAAVQACDKLQTY